MAVLTHSITTLARLKSFLGITNNNSDTELELLINACTVFIENYCHRRFKETTYTNERVNGNGDALMQFLAFPIDTSATFKIEHSADGGSSWSTLDADLYEIDYNAGFVKLKDGSKFVKGLANYRVSYKGGYSDLTTSVPDLEYASWKLIKTAFDKRKGNEGIKSQSLGQYSVVFTNSAFSNSEVKEILEQYRVYDV